MNISKIAFKASFITDVNIQRKENNTDKINATFVSLNAYNNSDIETIGEVALDWGFWDSYAFNIYDDMERISRNLMRYKDEESYFYALTKQKNSFEKLNYKDIIGVAEITKLDEHKIKLSYLQVKPDNVRNCINATYKHLGTSIMDTIKTIFPNKDIYLRSTKSAKNFYLANNFKKLHNSGNEYIFKGFIG